MAHHVAGTILPSDIPGKENRVYKRPVGVVAVISPWNLPQCSSPTARSRRRWRSATPSCSRRQATRS